MDYTYGEIGINFEQFKQLVTDQSSLFKRQDGRFYVILSLAEAEHLRSVMHIRRGMGLTALDMQHGPEMQNTVASMWTLGDFDAVMVASTQKNIPPAPKAQHKAMINSFRFVDSDMYFDDNSLLALLRVLRNNTPEERENWWNDVRACRRRSQMPWDGSIPISTLFTTHDEFQFLEFKAVVARVITGLQERGMFVFDAFRAFNSSHSGLLSCSEFYGGLEWLNIRLTPDQIYDLVRKIAVDNEGLISYLDFKRVFQGADDEFESRGEDADSFGVVQPKKIPELVDLGKVTYHSEATYICDNSKI